MATAKSRNFGEDPEKMTMQLFKLSFLQLLSALSGSILLLTFKLPLQMGTHPLIAAELPLEIGKINPLTKEEIPPCNEEDGCDRPVLDRSIPHLISPRATLVTVSATDNLILWWSAVEVPNYTPNYTVRIRGLDGTNWERDVRDTVTVYNGEPLQPGGRYIISVDAHNGEQPAESIFQVMTVEEEAEIDRQIAELETANLSEVDRLLETAKIYREAGAFSEAIAVLKTAIELFPETPKLYCEITSIYQEHYSELMALDFYQAFVHRGRELGATCPTIP